MDKTRKAYLKCEICGDEFYATWRRDRSKPRFCSSECRWENKLKHVEKRTAVCVTCGNPMHKVNYRNVYCSYSCSKEKWDSIAPDMTSKEWETIKEFVKERDGYKCHDCGTSVRLETHHILPVAFGGNHDISNLVCLCHRCHVNAHLLLRELYRSNEI